MCPAGGLVTGGKVIIMSTNIITNNKPRDIIYGYELPHYFKGDKLESVLSDLYYYTDDELQDAMLFIYKGDVYDLGEFMRIDKFAPQEFQGWDGYSNDSFFSGTLVKYTDDNMVIVAQYYS